MALNFTPWSQPAALPPNSPREYEPSLGARIKDNWWERGKERFKEAGGWTMPWQEEHWTAPQPDWTRNVGKAGLGVGLGALGALTGMAAPGALFGLGSAIPGLGGLAGLGAGLAPAAGHLGALGVLGGLGGLAGSSIMAPGGLGKTPPGGAPPPVQPGPPTAPPTAPPTLPEPGPPAPGFGGPETQPQVIEVGGQTFWWNPTGGMYGTGGWDLISGGGAGGRLTSEQQLEQAGIGRQHELEMLQLRYQLEQQAMAQQGQQSRAQQEAAAAQEMAQMYAADPYKYWAQMGQGTPEAVARLTGGEIGAGEEFMHTPMSTPSAQWWGNLLPSEQQQISGGLNWMGINPADWYSMYQRTIPGLGARQVGPQWAR